MKTNTIRHHRQSNATTIRVLTRCRAVWFAAGLLSIGLCSCRSGDRYGSRSHAAEMDPTAIVETPLGATDRTPLPRSQQPALARTSSPLVSPHTQQVGHFQVSSGLPADINMAPHRDAIQPVSFSPAEPRMPMHSGLSSVQQYPDEYLFDGGDRANPVHYDEFQRHGLDTEDTVAEYSDDRGKRHMKPTNRVAVYAPRFAAVRTLGQPVAGIGTQRPVGVQDDLRLGGLESKRGLGNHKQRFVPGDVRVQSRGSGIDSNLKEVTFELLTRRATHRNNIKPQENLALLHAGKLNRTQEAALASQIQAAVVWSKREYPVITASTKMSGEVSARFVQEEAVGREDMKKNPGELRIVKLADKDSAKSGDVITFTIRYDNVGDRELRNIRIVDNLTPRLEYVHDSADSDRDGKLVVEDNAESSLVLKFELKDALPGHTGGTVKFKARVR